MLDTIIKFSIFIVVCLILLVTIRILEKTENTDRMVGEIHQSLSGLSIEAVILETN